MVAVEARSRRPRRRPVTTSRAEMTRMGETVEFPSNGRSCSGYLATPRGGPGPGIVVIQEWWGLLPQIKGVCDRLAAQCARWQRRGPCRTSRLGLRR